MNAKAFLDTNVLLYTVAEDPQRTDVAEELLAEGCTISVQVLNEFAAVAHRKLKLNWDEVASALSDIRTLCEPPIPLTVEIHEAALRLASEQGFSFYDASIVAAALSGGCETLWSEDMQDGRRIEGLIIRNPFQLRTKAK